MNYYATVDDVKSVMNVTSTALDGRIFTHLETASRAIDAYCGSVFYTETATRYFNGRCGAWLYVDDFLNVSEIVTDSELDNTFDGETWVDGTDFVVFPDNSYPKIGLYALPSGNYAWRPIARNVKITGTWGYGCGKTGTPWTATTITATVADDSGTTLALSADDVVQVGHTLLVEDEQCFVTAISTGTATVERGVNGTTAAAHTAAVVSTAIYPAMITRVAATLAIGIMARADKGAMKTERIGDYSYTLQSESEESVYMGRALLGFVRLIP